MAILTLQSGPSTNTIIAADTTIVGQPFLVDGTGQTLQSIYPNNSNFVAASWSATGLPPGVSLIYRTTNFGVKKIWVFTGTPTTAGNFDIFLTGIDSNGNAFNEGPFRVYVRNTLPQVAPSQSFSGKLNESFSGTLAVLDPVNAPARGLTWDVGTGYTYGPNVWAFRETIEKWGPSEWGVNGLPPGLSFNATTGAISGLPTKAGTYSPVLYLIHGEPLVQVRRTSPVQYSTFTVEAGAPYIAGGQSASGKFGTAFNKTFSLLDSANRPATSWTATGLPPGLAIDSATGAVSGSPSLRGNFNVTLVATGPGGTSSPALVSISIALGAPSIQASQNFSGDRGAAFSATPVLSDIADRPVSSWSASGLPLGLSISATTGLITGTPLNRETKLAMVTATGPGGVGEATAVSFTIAAAYSAPIISAGQTLSGKVGVAFSATPALADAVERPVSSWAATGLPSWASLSATTGKITGTPQDSGTATFSITATGPGGTATEDIILAIAYGVPVVTSGQSFTGKVGTAFSATIALTDSVDRPATNLQISWLPAGLTLDQDTGVVSGIPTTTIAKSSSACFATGPGGDSPTATSVAFTISAGAPIISPGQIFTGKAGSLFSRTPSLTNAANRPVTSWSGSGLPPWANLSATTGLITGTPQTSGSFLAQITATGPGGVSEPFPLSIVIESQYPSPIIRPSQTFTVALGKDVLFPIAVEDPTVRPVDSLQVVSGSLPPGTSLNSTYIVGKPTTHGTFSFDLTATGPGGVSAPVAVSIVVAVQKPLLYKKSYSSKVGQSFFEYASAFLDSAPDRPATSFSVDQLPLGLSLNTATGNISGTPQQVTSLTSHLTATGPGGTSTPVDIAWTIAEGAPLIVGGQILTAKVGVPFSGTPSLTDAANRPVDSWLASGLPLGLAISSYSGEITGTPTKLGNFSLAVQATGPGGSSAQTGVVVAVSAGVPSITAGQTFTGRVGTAFSAKPALTDAANRPVTSWQAVTLPPWAALNTATGEVTGTPPELGSFNVTLTATGPGGTSAQATFIIGVSFGAVTITPGQSFTAKAGQLFSATPTLTAGSDAASTTWAHGLAPSWADINPTTGEITGRPELAKTDTLEIIATNADGSDTKSVSIVVAYGSPFISRGQKLSLKQGVETSIQLQSALPLDHYPITTWASADLPSWATLSQSGTITATAPISGASTEIHVTATGPGGTDTAAITLECFSQIPDLLTTSLSFPWGEYQEQALEFADPVNGKATGVFAVPPLPLGLSMSTDGKIFGSPSGSVGATEHTISSVNVAGTSQSAITINVTEGKPKIENQIFRGVSGKLFTASLESDTAVGNRPIAGWTSSDIPDWLILDAGTGTISGTPSNPITATFSITATGPGGTDTASVSVIVGLPVAKPVSASYAFALGQAVNETLAFVTAGRAPATSVTASSLPPGLKFENGKFTGVASQAGNFTTTVTAKNSSDSESTTITFSVAFAAPIITPGQAIAGKTDRNLSFQVSVVNAASRPATSWVAAGLPAGLSINGAGVISGLSKSAYTGTIQVTASSSAGSDSKVITIKITGSIFYGEKNPVLQPGRVVKSFPSGLVMVSSVYKMRPQNEASARSTFALGNILKTESTATGDLRIFPAADFKSIEAGFVEMVVSAYGITGSYQSLTARRLQSATVSYFVNDTLTTRQEKVLANTHTIRRAVPTGTLVTAPSGAPGVAGKSGYSLATQAVIERYDVQNFGAFDEVTVTTAYEVTFTQQ